MARKAAGSKRRWTRWPPMSQAVPTSPWTQRPARGDPGMALVEPARTGAVAGDHRQERAQVLAMVVLDPGLGALLERPPRLAHAPAEVDVAGRADPLGEPARARRRSGGGPAGCRSPRRPPTSRACPRPGRGSCDRGRSGRAASPARRPRRSRRRPRRCPDRSARRSSARAGRAPGRSRRRRTAATRRRPARRRRRCGRSRRSACPARARPAPARSSAGAATPVLGVVGDDQLVASPSSSGANASRVRSA